MIKNNTKINVLGQIYTICYHTKDEDATLADNDGYCDTFAHKIIIDATVLIRNELTDDLDKFIHTTIRHEIIHAFLFESGLSFNSNESEAWAINEEMVDWLSLQFPKINKLFVKLGIEE